MGVLFDISSKIVLENDSTEALNYVFNSSNSDVVAAYSFRRLSPDYYGALIRVRNKELQTEKDFYPNADGKIDIDELKSYVKTPNRPAFLISFYNQAANPKSYTNPTTSDGNATAPTNQTEPRIVNTQVVNRTNGLISAPLIFNNNEDYLKVDNIATGSLSNQITGNMFAYFVGAHDGTSSNNAMFSKSGEYEFVYTSSTNVQYSDSTSAVNLNITSVSSGLRIHSFSRNKNANTIDLQVNGASLTGAISGAINATNEDLYIGAKANGVSNFLGDFQELVIFNTYKNSTEKDTILNGVNKYYNVY